MDIQREKLLLVCSIGDVYPLSQLNAFNLTAGYFHLTNDELVIIVS